MKNSSYYIAPAGVRTHDLPHAVASNMGKVSHALTHSATAAVENHTFFCRCIFGHILSIGVAGGVCNDGGLRKHVTSWIQSLRTDRSDQLWADLPAKEIASQPGGCNSRRWLHTFWLPLGWLFCQLCCKWKRLTPETFKRFFFLFLLLWYSFYCSIIHYLAYYYICIYFNLIYLMCFYCCDIAV